MSIIYVKLISRDDTKSHVNNISPIQQLTWKSKHHEWPTQEPALWSEL